MRARGISAIARGIGCAAVAAAIVAAALHFRQDLKPPDPSRTAAPASADRLARELARCQALGMAAKDDVVCAAAWAENRRRFFGGAPPPDMPAANAKPGQPR